MGVRLTCDVVVVGAGLVGCALAASLAGRGVDVVLIDRKSSARAKVCGEGLMPRGVSCLAALGLLEEVVSAGARPFSGIRWRAGGAVATGRFPGGGVGLGVRRDDLDARMRARASAVCRVMAPVKVLRVGAPGEVLTDCGPVQGRLVIGADGLHSVVRRTAGLAGKPTLRPRYGARLHWTLRDHEDADVVEVLVGPDAELYLTPTGPSEINVAFLLEERPARALSGDLPGGLGRLLDSFPAMNDLRSRATVVTEPALVGPLRQACAGVSANRLLLVGDAAGFLDGITGEGMSLGLLAAERMTDFVTAALAADRLDAVHLGKWDPVWRELRRDHVAMTELVLWWVRHPFLARRIVQRLGARPHLFDTLLGVNDGTLSGKKAVWALLRLLTC